VEEVEGEAADRLVVRRRRPRHATLRLDHVHQIEQKPLGRHDAAVREAGAGGEHAKVIGDSDGCWAKLLGAVEVWLQVRECWRCHSAAAHADSFSVSARSPLTLRQESASARKQAAVLFLSLSGIPKYLYSTHTLQLPYCTSIVFRLPCQQRTPDSSLTTSA
jgi:hypothetical protein